MTLAELVVAEGHDHLDQLRDWLEQNGAAVLQRLDLPNEITFSTGLLVPRPAGIRLILEPQYDRSALASVSATLAGITAEMGTACNIDVSPRLKGPSEMHISVATFRDVERSGHVELAFNDAAVASTLERDGSVELHASSASLVLATQAPYSGVQYFQQVSLGRSLSAE